MSVFSDLIITYREKLDEERKELPITPEYRVSSLGSSGPEMSL